MKTFHCDDCGNLVFFENVNCLKCGHALGFLPSGQELSALEPGDDGTWRPPARERASQLFKFCDNARHHVCNWMVEAGDANPFCQACRLNELIPDISLPDNLTRWHKLETAKHRIVYTFLRLGLPMDAAQGEGRTPLRFKFAGDLPGADPVVTVHADGVITVNIAEADDVERERRRLNLHEPYRTLLGHLRHEVSHYYWDRLIAGSKWLPKFRALFGDETADYGAALDRYYKHGPPQDWQARHVSAYASAHPWEDWAETGAHYFHIMDMVETAGSFGITLAPKHPSAGTMTAMPQNSFNQNHNFDRVLKNWFPLTYALNSLSRGMGLPDVYPFVLSPVAIEKLEFIHEVMQAARTAK